MASNSITIIQLLTEARGICVWEVESVERLREFLDGQVGHMSQNDYYQVENKDAVALPSAV